MSKTSPFDRAEFCDVNGEYSGSVGGSAGWIDTLAEKSEVRNFDDGLEDSIGEFQWLVGPMRKADAELAF